MVDIEVGRTSSGARVAVAAAAVAAAAGVMNAVIAVAATAVGVPPVPQLSVPGVLLVSVVASVVAVIGWSVVRDRAADPARLLRRLVPLVLVVSLVPDLLLGLVVASASGWSPILVLASMHLVTAAIVLLLCGRLLPVGATTPRRDV